VPIKNYTTEISAEKSMGEIQGLLRKVKVRGAYMSYDDDGEPIGLAFDVETNWGRRSYLLPADVDNVQRVLARQIGPHRATREQAARVAWRLVKDWVAVQIAFIESGAAVFEQVMLPYMQDENGRTVYDLASERYQPALPAGKA
jgi:hypothetical protein